MAKKFNVSMTVTIGDDSGQHEEDLEELAKRLITSWLNRTDENPYNYDGDYSDFEDYCRDRDIYKGDIEMAGSLISIQEASNVHEVPDYQPESANVSSIHNNSTEITTIDQHNIVSNMNLNIF